MKKFDLPIYVLGFLYTIILLVAGAGIGVFINSSIDRSIEDSLTNLESQNYFIMYQLDPATFCKTYEKMFGRLEDETWQVGEKIQIREEKGNVDDSAKERYMSFLARDYYIAQKAVEECHAGTKQIIYFYTNKNSACSDCNSQGYELSVARKTLKDMGKDARIYSFEGGLGVGEVMKEKFNVTSYPALIINGQKYQGFKNAAQIVSLAG